MHGTAMDTATAFFIAQSKHNKQLRRLTQKPVCKWKAKDFAAIEATRKGLALAVAALGKVEEVAA